MKTLDVGCGDRCRGDVCLDIAHTKDCNIIGNACFLPFQKESFDNLIATALLEHLETPTQALREFIRVLKPKGILILAVPKPWLTNSSRFLLARFILNLPLTLLPQYLKLLFIISRRLKREPRIRHKSIITRAYMEKQAKKLGFAITEFTELEDLIYCYFPRRKRQKLRKLFQFKPKLYHGYKIVCQKRKK